MTAGRGIVEIQWTRTAVESLQAVGSRSLRRKIVEKVGALLGTDRPELIGKPLQDELAGLYRITHGRYRIVYEVQRRRNGPVTILRITVRILYVGLRREGGKTDVYVRIAKLLRRLSE